VESFVKGSSTTSNLLCDPALGERVSGWKATRSSAAIFADRRQMKIEMAIAQAGL
jgi:hypothetical protein